MKYLKTYEEININFQIGDYVKISNVGISYFLSNIKEFPEDFEAFKRKITEKDLKNKYFRIIDYDYLRTDLYNNPVPYRVKNINDSDEFDWGWSNGKFIRYLTKNEKDELNLLLNTNKYNL